MVGDDVEGLRPELCMSCSSANNTSILEILHNYLNLYDMAVYGQWPYFVVVGSVLLGIVLCANNASTT